MHAIEGGGDLACWRRVADNGAMTGPSSPMPESDGVRAATNYLGRHEGKPRFHAQEPGRDSWSPDPHRMAIENMHGWAEPPLLAREGVTLVRHQSAVGDFDDPDEIARVYLPELERLLLEITGAAQVVMLPKAVPRYSARSPRYRMGENSRPALSGVPQDTPLAICDARSVGPDDLVKADGVYDYGPEPWTTSEAYMLRFNPQHRWLYFRDVQPDELMIFRAYNWGPEFIPGVAHSALEDPSAPPDAPARISIEARAFAVFDA